MKRVKLKKLFLFFSLLGIFVAISPFIWRFMIQQYYEQKIFDLESVPTAHVAIVFGAGIDEDDSLSDMLQDRMDVAIALYEAGKVEKLLLSGDNRFEDYDEPGAMQEYALSRGVEEDDIQPDYGGRRTYDTCYRAKNIFQVKEAILVTQQFHLSRALFNCRQLGIEAVGVSSDLQPYLGARWLAIREVGATLQSTWDLIRKNPPPVMGEAIPITE